MKTSKYVPRNDFVVVRLIDLGKSAKGVLVPSISKEGKEMRVVSLGPKVEGLKVNDSVLISMSQDTFPIPNEQNLFVVKEDCIAVVVSDNDNIDC